MQATATIFQATATGLAFIVGGLFAYYRFFKEEPYSSRLQPSVSTAVSHFDGHYLVVITATVENTGQTPVRLDKSKTHFLAAVRSLNDPDWTPHDTAPILQQSVVQPGETFSDQTWVEILDSGEVALRTELVVGKALEEGETVAEDEVVGWGTRDIVSLLDSKGKITDTPDEDAERGQ